MKIFAIVKNDLYQPNPFLIAKVEINDGAVCYSSKRFDQAESLEKARKTLPTNVKRYKQAANVEYWM